MKFTMSQEKQKIVNCNDNRNKEPWSDAKF